MPDEITPDGAVVEQPQPEPQPSNEAPKNLDKEVVPEDAKLEDVDINDFLDAAERPLGVKASEEPKKEEKVDETVPKEEVDSTPARPTRKELVAKDKATRDVKDFEDDKELVEYLSKDMSRKAFDKIKPLLAEGRATKKELETAKKQYEDLRKQGPQLPDSYYDHEQGYLLNPDFRNSAAALNDSQQILAHWEKQLEDVAGGAAEFDYLDRNKQTGQLEITGKVKADKLSETKLLRYVSHAQNLVAQRQANIQQIMQTHGQKTAERIGGVQKFMADTFGAFDKPENKATYEPLIKEKMEMFKEFAGNPLVPLLARSLTMSQALAHLLKQAADDKAKAPTNGKAKVKISSGGPTGEEIGGDGGGKTKGGEVSMEDFNRVKMGL